ncbi:probable serine/threonine-protein kinase tsuA isoform X2 [Musca domestica]|uniref:Probable serine/threonine-protein kinase tsuA isoform X2 n=1 Tax=Musca domestica TaxID=7370 RepID=A0A9J7D3I3_MUSDO|nr:probable serine/threonine-protein kinase tsuA isoform X2 [Musca domestica]
MVGAGPGGGDNNKIVATLRSDCKVVYPTNQAASTTLEHQLASLMNYKIRTEGEIANKSLNTLSVPTTVVDLGKQLLQYARDSDVKGVKNALSRGAPFTSDWLGMSALHFAAMNNQYEICQVLLSGGINKDSKTKVDRTPLHLASYYGNEQIVELLLSKNCAVNPKDMLRMTPLHWAVEKRHKSIVRLLLKHNADVTVVTKFGRTPLAIAVLTEQADLLEELESARQAQANRTFNEQHEKETSEAVNSIMGLTEANEESEGNANARVQDGEEYMAQNEYAAAKIAELENIKETGIIGDSTINLLKSHGISMMPDDDTSKDMLNTALQNGRQLILSEGGKLLLNETKKIQNNNNTNLNNNNNFNINGSNKTIVPARARNDSATYVSSSSNSNVSRLKPNVITKAKDNQHVTKNKNIRIISINDFKKLYGNTNLKAMQKLPQSVTSQQRVVNVRQPMQMKQQQVKLDMKSVDTGSSRQQVAPQENIGVLEEDILPHIIQVSNKDENDIIELEAQKSHTLAKTVPSHQQTTIAKQAVRLVPAKRVEHMNTVPVRQMNTAKTIKLNPSKPLPSQDSKSTPVAPSVIPLLTVPEICRQLLELRKQNDELRRKFEIAQKEKEELRLRLDRLEELLLVERTEEEYNNS